MMLGGIFGRDWHPVTALVVYWLESVLLVLGTAALCALIVRRVSPADIEEARRAGDMEGVRALEAERAELQRAGIAPKDILMFHLGSLMIFGGFFAGLLVILVGNGHLEQPIQWGEIRAGAQAMAFVVAIGVAIDLWSFPRMSAADVQARVDAATVRWGLFWLLGFAGSFLLAFTGRAAAFFGFFAGLKVLFESWGTLARVFGWRSLEDRERAAAPRV